MMIKLELMRLSYLKISERRRGYEFLELKVCSTKVSGILLRFENLKFDFCRTGGGEFWNVAEEGDAK